MADDLTDVETRFKRSITAQVKARADSVRAERDATNAIAALCVEARAEGVTMAKLADWVRVLDPKADKLRPVTRQAVDQLVAAYENRPRAPRKKKAKASSNGHAGSVKMEAFGG